MMTTPTDLADRSSLARDIVKAQLLDAEISMRLSRCPPPTAENLRWFQERLRRSVRAMQMLEAAAERRKAS